MSEYRLSFADYAAVVTAQAGALRELRHRGRDLIVPFPEGGPIPDYRGIIATPWPNRIADGRYVFDGATYDLPINEPERGCALHGLAFPKKWTLLAQDRNSVTLSVAIGSIDGYPHALQIDVEYVLSDMGLHSRVTARNTGGTAAPYGVCPHPYLIAGEAPLDEWFLEVPARSFLEVTSDRLLPKVVRSVEDHEFDFRAGRIIGATKIDHAFTDIAFDETGQVSLEVRDPSGTGVGMAWDRSCQWLQIHTADKPTPASNRVGIAVEPMTCPPDAFNSAIDLLRLEPGTDHEASWSIYAAGD